MSISTDPSLNNLFVHVRSLRRWTLATSLILLSYLAVVVLQILWLAREEGLFAEELDVVFALVLGIGAFVFSMMFTIPAWFAMAASHKAARAVSSGSVAPLASSAKWLRRFLIAAGASLLIYALMAAGSLVIYVLRLVSA